MKRNSPICLFVCLFGFFFLGGGGGVGGACPESSTLGFVLVKRF